MLSRSEKTLADSYCENNQFELAIEHYDEEILTQSTSFIAWHNRGFAKSKLKQFEAALIDYTQSNSLNESEQTYRNRSQVFYILGKYEKARKDIAKLIQLNPNDTDAHNQGGDIFRAEKKYPHAIWAYSNTIKIDPNNSYAYYQRANTHFDNKQVYSKINYYEVVSNQVITCSSPWYKGKNGFNVDFEKYCKPNSLYNIEVEERSDYEAAISDLSQYIQLKPKEINGYYLRGICYSGINSLETNQNSALDDFNQCNELDPFYFPPYQERVYVYSEQKKNNLVITNLAYIDEKEKRNE